MSLVDPGLAERVLERALARGGDFAELYAEARQGFAISLDDGRVERPQGGRERGACVRVVQGDSTYYGHVDGLAEEDLLRVAESAPRPLRGEAPAPAARWTQRGRRAGTRSRRAPRTWRSSARPSPARLRRARARDGAARWPRRASATPSRGARSRCSARTGRAAADDRTRVRLSAQVVARRDGRVETGSDTRGGHAGWELIEAEPERVAELAARARADAARRGRRAHRPAAGRGRERLRRRAAARGGRARAGGRRRAEARERLRRPARRPARRAVRDRLRRRPPPERVGQRRHRRRGHAHPAHHGDRGRAADRLPVRRGHRAPRRRRADRQRPARVVPPPAGRRA